MQGGIVFVAFGATLVRPVVFALAIAGFRRGNASALAHVEEGAVGQHTAFSQLSCLLFGLAHVVAIRAFSC